MPSCYYMHQPRTDTDAGLVDKQVSVSCVIILNQDVEGEGLLLPYICLWFGYFLWVPSIYEILLYPAFLVESNTTHDFFQYLIACSLSTGCWGNFEWL